MSEQTQQIKQLHQSARDAMSRGDYRDAHKHCLALLQIDRRHADAWFVCGVIAASNGQQVKAIEIFRNAVMLEPGNAEYLSELGKYLLATGEQTEALELANRAFATEPNAAPVLATLGTLLSHCGEHDRALLCFARVEEALQKERSHPDQHWLAEFYFNRAASLQFSGAFDQARSQLERVLALEPKNFRAHFALSSLYKSTEQDNRLEELTALRKSATSPRDKLQLGHAIAKVQEDLGQYEASLASLHWAKQAHALEVEYSAQGDAQLFKGVRSLFNSDYFSGSDVSCDSAEPIFIVGMPRTGTTLVEQILASHSQVFAAGELQNFGLEVRRAAQASSGNLLDLEMLTRAADKPSDVLGQAYLDSTRPRTGHTPHFIDKLPLNFFYVGLIARALPRARIICLRRDPMDTCVSNYRQLFATNFPYYRYNYDLMDCGRYYIEFDRLMQHWHTVLPGRVYDIQYEKVVANPEREARALLKHCNLPWEENCLGFDRGSGSVATPSAVQVRQGIYSSSVDRWRRYGEAMDPLHALLKSEGFYN